MKKPSSLRQRLSNTRTHLRENIFYHKLCFDLKVAAVNSGLDIQIHPVEYDDHGYDVIIRDQNGFDRRFQVKTKLLPGGATSWQCHSQLFCPLPSEAATWDIDEWNCREAWGYNGGFILMTIEWKEGHFPNVFYHYCDLSIIMAYRDGFLDERKKIEKAKSIFAETSCKPFEEKRKFKLSQLALVRPRDTQCLLSIMGFNVWLPNTGDYNASFRYAYSRKYRGINNNVSEEVFKHAFFRSLRDRVL